MIKRSIPWTSQPQYPAQVDKSGTLFDASKLSAVIAPGAGSYLIDALTGKKYTVSSSPAKVVSPLGQGIGWVGNTNDYLELDADADNLLDTSSCSILIATTRNSASVHNKSSYGYDTSAANRTLIHLPFTDNNVYWDFGDSTAGSGRLSVSMASYLAVGTVNIWGFYAGVRGREIWRNGVLLASNTGATASRSTTTLGYRIGSCAAAANNAAPYHNDSLFVLSKEGWQPAAFKALTENPWRVFSPQQRNIYVSVAGGGLSASLGQPSETDTVSALTSAKAQSVGLISATDTAQGITSGKAGSLGLITSTETAQSLAAAKSSAIGQSAETDSLFTISTAKSVSAALVTETETAQPLTAIKYAELGQASETEESLALVSSATSNLGLIAETDTVFAITAIKTTALGLPSESDSALSVSASKTAMLGLVTEIEYPLPLVSSASSAVGQVVETDTAFAVNVAKLADIGYPTETDSAPSMSAAKMVTLGLVTETGYVFALTSADEWAGEPFNFASPITRTFGFTSSVTKNLNFESPI